MYVNRLIDGKKPARSNEWDRTDDSAMDRVRKLTAQWDPRLQVVARMSDAALSVGWVEDGSNGYDGTHLTSRT